MKKKKRMTRWLLPLAVLFGVAVFLVALCLLTVVSLSLLIIVGLEWPALWWARGIMPQRGAPEALAEWFKGPRVYAAFTFGLVSLMWTAFFMFLALPLFLLVKFLRLWRLVQVMEGLICFTTRLHEAICLKYALGMKVKDVSPEAIAPAKKGQFLLYICNHPAVPFLFSVGAPVMRRTPSASAVAKAAFGEGGLSWLGKPGQIFSIMWLIVREEPERAKAMLREQLKRSSLNRFARSALIFADGTRPEPDRIEADIRSFEGKGIEGLREVFTETRLPRSGGVQTLVHAARRIVPHEGAIRIFDMTYGPSASWFSEPGKSFLGGLLGTLRRLVGETMYVHVRDITPIARQWQSEEDVRQYLMEAFREKNTLLRKWRSAT